MAGLLRRNFNTFNAETGPKIEGGCAPSRVASRHLHPWKQERQGRINKGINEADGLIGKGRSRVRARGG